MTTKSINSTNIKRMWWTIDASTMNLGRLSTVIADKLIGKNKVDYTPHVDNGDYVVVTNSDKIKTTGNKSEKPYYRHSGYPGGIKKRTLSQQMEKDSTQVIISSVKGMLPKNKLTAQRLNRLKVYAAENHEHNAQKPQKLEVGK